MRTLKTVEIWSFPSGGLGRCPKNPQGASPLTLYLGSAQTRPRRKQGKGRSSPFSQAQGCSVVLMSRDFRGITGPLPHYSTVPLTTAPLRSRSRLFLHVQDGLLA